LAADVAGHVGLPVVPRRDEHPHPLGAAKLAFG
jgi:hypothetical protein